VKKVSLPFYWVVVVQAGTASLMASTVTDSVAEWAAILACILFGWAALGSLLYAMGHGKDFDSR